MKTLIVSGDEPIPAPLRDIIQKGSTSLDDVSARDLTTYVSREGLGVDRVVFWTGRRAGAKDQDLRALALNYATAAGAERAQSVVFITGAPSDPPLEGMPREELHVWPRDEEKIRMIFMTGG